MSMDPLAAKAVAAACGATLTGLTMTPFDVVKTRLQTQTPSPLFPRPPSQMCCHPSPIQCVRYMSSLARSSHAIAGPIVCLWDGPTMRSERVTGFADAIRKVWRAEGARGLWKGVGTTLMIAVPSQTAYMLTYDHLLHKSLPALSPDPSLTPLAAGILARTIISSIASPLELLRTNLQSTPLSPTNPNTLPSVINAIQASVRVNGAQSLWRGLGPTLWRDVPFSGIYWASYEYWKQYFQQQQRDGPIIAFVSGSISGTTAAIITQPFDVLKTRRQALLLNSSLSPGGKSSMIPLLLRVIRTEGPGVLFAGMTPRMAKITPACGIMIASYEGIGNLLTGPREED